ncbi:MAG: YqeG family HAD IIIA-type phosphatase [Erysipelotrichaceae bacterium]|nr:YqeG family HAD IIIA-type phosphatase [Erysipelotrichaceae bacterium]
MIKDIFKPDIYIKDFSDLDLNFLKTIGIKVIILDVDNTLVPADSNVVDEKAIRFIKQVKSAKIIPIIVSNNKKSRVSYLSNKLNCEYISFSLKPLNISFKKVMKKYNVIAGEICIMGDQILTDILGGNRLNIVTILVNPISKKDNIYGSVIRIAEKFVYKFIGLKKGDYYEKL